MLDLQFTGHGAKREKKALPGDAWVAQSVGRMPSAQEKSEHISHRRERRREGGQENAYGNLGL